jgi:hypothetical protein
MSLEKQEPEQKLPDETVTASRVVAGYEIGAGLGLLAVAVLVPTVAMVWRGKPAEFREFTSMILLWIYMFAVIATFSIIILWGLGRLILPEKFMNWLGGATIGEIAGMVLFVVKQIFNP